jgi:hypothetical protein
MIDKPGDATSNYLRVQAGCDGGAVDRQSSSSLLHQIRRQVPGGVRKLAVEVRPESATVLLTGWIHSFYAKQLIYRVCEESLPGFRVLDATIVSRPQKPMSA